MIFFHADDFGVNKDLSQMIINCHTNGVLNSLSFMVNSPCIEDCYELIREYVDEGKIRAVVHLNFVEGRAMANPSDIPHLIDESGQFNASFAQILKYNFSRQRTLIKNELKAEIVAQLDFAKELIKNRTLNIDSHQHYLQIPVVWEAFMEAVDERCYKIKSLRIPTDPVSPILKNPGLMFKVSPINYVKWAILKLLSPKKSQIQKVSESVPVFFGMPFTCKMTKEIVQRLLPEYKKAAKGRDLEIMFHPGAEHDVSKLMDPTNPSLVNFYSDEYRKLEYIALTECSYD